MRILYSTYCGRSGVVDYEERAIQKKFGESRKMGEVTGLGFLNNEENEVAYLHQDGDVILTNLDEELKFNGISILDVQGSNYNNNSMAIDKSNQNIFCSNLNGDITKVNYKIEPETYELSKSSLYKHQVEALNKIMLTPEKPALTLLCKQANPTILDIETQSIIWRPKNAPRDELDLETPMNDLNGLYPNSDPNTLITTNAYSKIRCYDIRKQKKRPYNDWELKETIAPIGAVCISPDDNTLYVGNYQGAVYALDRRKDYALVKKFKESKGAITSLAAHPTAPYVMSTSLDRYLRVYNVNTYKTEWNFCVMQR